MGLPIITTEMINARLPCTGDSNMFGLGWEGTSIDGLNYDGASTRHVMWCVLHPESTPESVLYQFSIDCVDAINARNELIAIKEGWLDGSKTDEELTTATSEVEIEEAAAQLVLETAQKVYSENNSQENEDAIYAAILAKNRISITIVAASTDPATGSWKTFVLMLKIDQTKITWAKIRMLEMLEPYA